MGSYNAALSDLGDELTEDNLNEMLDSILYKGATLAHVRGISDDEIESLYAQAYQNFQSGKHQQAEGYFRLLCLFDHVNKKNWIGLGACLQALTRYEEAVDVYSHLRFIDLSDPEPPFYRACCRIALGDYQSAQADLLLCMNGSDEQSNSLYGQAQQLHQILLSDQQGEQK